MKPGFTADEIRENIERQQQAEESAAARIRSAPVRLYAYLNILYCPFTKKGGNGTAADPKNDDSRTF